MKNTKGLSEIKEHDVIDNSLVSDNIINLVMKKMKILYQIIFIFIFYFIINTNIFRNII